MTICVTLTKSSVITVLLVISAICSAVKPSLVKDNQQSLKQKKVCVTEIGKTKHCIAQDRVHRRVSCTRESGYLLGITDFECLSRGETAFTVTYNNYRRIFD